MIYQGAIARDTLHAVLANAATQNPPKAIYLQVTVEEGLAVPDAAVLTLDGADDGSFGQSVQVPLVELADVVESEEGDGITDADYTPGERAILREVRELRKEIANMASEEQADFTALQGTVEGLETDEHEAATEFSTLAEEIKGLTAGAVTAAQINELNAKAVALGERLKADVAGA